MLRSLLHPRQTCCKSIAISFCSLAKVYRGGPIKIKTPEQLAERAEKKRQWLANYRKDLVWNDEKMVRWQSLKGINSPKRVMVVKEPMAVEKAIKLCSTGTALLIKGDYHNASILLAALGRRIDGAVSRKEKEKVKQLKKDTGVLVEEPTNMKDIFNAYRQSRSIRSRVLDMILIPFEATHEINLPRAPNAVKACLDVYGVVDEPYVASLRELIGMIGAYEWRKKGIPLKALKGEGLYDRIHPHHGVFSPIRNEYVDLVNQAPLPIVIQTVSLAFDIGTGTGVLAAVLSRRGIARIIATDNDKKAVLCATENMSRLNVEHNVEVLETNLYPPGQAALIVCNPPWIPAKPGTSLDNAIFDFKSMMLVGFLSGLKEHLVPGGEGWLVLSDIAEHLQLRSREELLKLIEDAGLRVVGTFSSKPMHNKAADIDDRLYVARKAEVTTLWRLAVS